MATKAKTAPKKKVNTPKASRSAKKAPAKPAKRSPARPSTPKPAAKKPTPKKAPAKRTAKPTPAAQKAVPKKPAAKKAPLKKAPAKKAAPHKAPARKAANKAAPKTAPKTAPKAAPAAPVKSGKPPRAFRPEELATFRSMLQQQLELVQDNLNALASDNLKRSPLESTGDISSHSTHMADHGTDNFDRELALSLASSRQDSLYDIEDAIRRIDDGEYGACEFCGCAIERPRLKALPFAKKCLACQNAAERGRGRFQPFRSNSHVPAGTPDDTPESSDS
jgi:RNA polymerase-binding transcription factor DksA